MITGFRHTGIVVSDLDAAESFWCDVMGFSVSRRMEESGSYIDVMLNLNGAKVTTLKLAAPDGTLIELLKFYSHPDEEIWSGAVYQTGLTHIALTVDDVEVEYRRLIDLGVVFIAQPQQSPDGAALVTFCKSPEGTLIELVEML